MRSEIDPKWVVWGASRSIAQRSAGERRRMLRDRVT
jgi:hypothetical protein